MESLKNLFATEDVVENFKEILKSNEIHDKVSNVIVNASGNKGDGFASQTLCVTVTFENPEVKPLNLFLKTETPNPSHSKFLESLRAFERESSFFTEYVPLAKAFCDEKGQGELLNIYPKCYFGDRKLIVLEDLVKDRGFELLDMKTGLQDLDAARLAMTTLAKHHALSWSMIKELGGPEKFLKKFPSFAEDAFKTDAVKNMMNPTAEAAIQINLELLRQSSVSGKEKAIKLLEEKSGVVWNTIRQALELNLEDKVLLLAHGDYWNNNMMFFRDKNSNCLVNHVAIDMQIVKYESPAYDIGYYLFSSVKEEVRRKHFKELLTFYLNALHKVAETLGNPINLTYDELFQSFRQKFPFAFWFCGTMTTKAALSAMKEFDVNTYDMNEFGTFMADYVRKWIADNPEECEQDAIKIVELMLEYDSFRL